MALELTKVRMSCHLPLPGMARPQALTIYMTCQAFLPTIKLRPAALTFYMTCQAD